MASQNRRLTMSNFRNRQSAEILGSVYKNAEMAYEASGEVL